MNFKSLTLNGLLFINIIFSSSMDAGVKFSEDLLRCISSAATPHTYFAAQIGESVPEALPHSPSNSLQDTMQTIARLDVGSLITICSSIPSMRTFAIELASLKSSIDSIYRKIDNDRAHHIQLHFLKLCQIDT